MDKMLYKYTDQKFIDSFINLGRIKVGSLHDFKQNKEYDEVIGDEKEGQIDVSKHFHGYYPDGVSEWGITAGKSSTISNTTAYQKYTSPNYYIYCLSRRLNPYIASAFHTNGCIEIIDVIRFADLITEKLYELGLVKKSYIISPTFYFKNPGTNLDIPDVDPTALVKRIEYSYQEEVRILWTLLTPKKVKPQIIDIGPLNEIAKKVDIEQDKRSKHFGSVFKNIQITGANLIFINPTIIDSQFEKCKITIHSFISHQFIGNVAFKECEFILADDIKNGIQSFVNLSNTKGLGSLLAKDISRIKSDLGRMKN